jgi:hypothetical protein
MRTSGPRRLLVYCADYPCAHHVEIDAERWPDRVRLCDLEPMFVWSRIEFNGLTGQKRADAPKREVRFPCTLSTDIVSLAGHVR